jgi:HPt (histidine-containing phosphotransfer) domain-containing protein
MHAGLLDFFILEASECVERLDGLLAHASSGVSDFDAFVRDVRALRGSATMSKIQGIADVASGLERIGKGLRDGSVAWSEALKGAVVAAIDDLKILIRGVRTWGSAEERRAADRAAELQALAPAAHRRSAATPSVGGGSADFLASEMARVAASLVRYADDPGPISAFEETLRHVRALRGVAALLDLPPLAEVVATVDESTKKLELTGASPTAEQQELFRAAAAVLREGSDAVHGGGRPDPGSAAVEAFTAAASSFHESGGETDQVVPISTLFPDGGGPHVLHASSNPPTTPSQRFKLEVISHSEHLRRLVFDARGAADAPTRQRLGRELRGAVLLLARKAESFAEDGVAKALHAFVDGAAALEERVLAALEEASVILTTPGTTPFASRIEALAGTAPTPVRASTPVPAGTPATPIAVTPTPRPATPLATPPVIVRAPTPEHSETVASTTPLAAAPSGGALHDMLGAGIAGLSHLADEPLSEPVPVEDDGIVPIQDLLYRGTAALRRAIELGDVLKKSATAADPGDLAELYDLLELTTSE